MYGKLKARHLEILRDLITYTVPLDITFFEEKFSKSARTIRYDINELKSVCEKYGAEIRYRTKQGFYIPASQKMACSEVLIANKGQEKSEFMLDNDEERLKKLFLYFFSQNGYVTADQTANEFFVSKSTVLRLFQKMEQYYKRKICLVSRKMGGYELQGEELTLRKIAAGIMAERFKGSYTPEDWYLLMPEPLKSYMSLQSLIQITNGIKKVNAKYNVWISNTAFLNLLTYCIVRNYRYYFQNRRQREPAEEDIVPYAADLIKAISYQGDRITAPDAKYMQSVLEENGIAVQEAKVEADKLKLELKKMVELLVENSGEVLGEFDLSALYQDLYAHLKASLCLCKTDRKEAEENYIVIQEVRDNYSSFYHLAQKCGAFLKESLTIEFTETEICYIAIYLYKNCKKQQERPKKVLVVCATGKGLSNLMAIRIGKVFPMLEVVGQASPYQLSHQDLKKEVDFIISTVPLNSGRLPVIKISGILSEEDIKRIQDFLNYGEMIDEIPLSQKDQASFGPKSDSFMPEAHLEYSRKELIYATNVLSRLILTLLEYTSKFPETYKMSQDTLLGLIIHMSMAIPRWYEGRKEQAAAYDYEAEYRRIRSEHKEISEIMEKFFELVEQSLRVSIAIEEKIAFFLYMIKED